MVEFLADHRECQRTPAELADYIPDKIRKADKVFIHYIIGEDAYWISASKDRHYTYADIYFDLAQTSKSVLEEGE